LVFPAPSLAVVPCGLPSTARCLLAPPGTGLRGLPTADARSVTRSAAPPWPSPPLRSLRSALADSTGPKSGSAGRLSWDSPVRPSIVCPSGTGSRPVLPPDVVPNRLTRNGSALVVSHHLDGLPSPEVAGLLHPAADPGVRRVSIRRLDSGRTGASGRAHSPRRTFVPLEESPRRQPHHVTVAVALMRFAMFTSRARPLAQPGRTGERRRPMGSGPPIARRTSTHRSDGAATSGPCSADEFVPNPYRSGYRRRKARFFLGFVPLQGPP
jgi:hypothetical protein